MTQPDASASQVSVEKNSKHVDPTWLFSFQSLLQALQRAVALGAELGHPGRDGVEEANPQASLNRPRIVFPYFCRMKYPQSRIIY